MTRSLFRRKPKEGAQLKKRLEYFPGRILLRVREQPLTARGRSTKTNKVLYN